jgi:hypothetical protein
VKTVLAVLVLATSARAQSAPASWERLEGQHSGITAPLAEAVRDERKWTDLWHEHDADAAVPPVDFSRESVVVVFLGRRQTAGVKVSVVVQPDPLDPARLNVFYREVDAKKPFAADVLCEPYAMVKVRRAAVIDIEPDSKASTPERAAAVPAADPAKLESLRPALSPTFSFDGRRP